jgi:hypothetical protein
VGRTRTQADIRLVALLYIVDGIQLRLFEVIIPES